MTDVDEVAISDDDRRLIGLWAADCAERALPLFEAKAPSDARPREAIEGIRAFAREGMKRTRELRAAALAALAAAREVDDPAATAAARAAGYAAATPYVHPLATVHQAKHILSPATYQARARELAVAAAGDAARTTDPAQAAADAEIRWAIEHATHAVRQVLRQMPRRELGRTRLDALFYQLDSGLRR